MKLRVSTDQDMDAVSALLRKSYEALMPSSYPQEVLALALPAMVQAQPVLLVSSKFVVVLDDTDKILGCGGWSFERPVKGDVKEGLAHIRHFATDPDVTHRGIGRQIYEWCEEQAKLSSVKQFECYSSLNGVKFYAAMGFEPEAEVNIPTGGSQNFTAILMRKHI